MGLAFVRLLIIGTAIMSGAAWRYTSEPDPLGQTVHIAEIVPDPARPYVALRLFCGGIAGVSLQVNLGQIQTPPKGAEISFSVDGGKPYSTPATLAPITDGLGTFEIKGSEAGNIARLLTQGAAVTVSEGGTSETFPLDGSGMAIGEVSANCPYKL